MRPGLLGLPEESSLTYAFYDSLVSRVWGREGGSSTGQRNSRSLDGARRWTTDFPLDMGFIRDVCAQAAGGRRAAAIDRSRPRLSGRKLQPIVSPLRGRTARGIKSVTP